MKQSKFKYDSSGYKPLIPEEIANVIENVLGVEVKEIKADSNSNDLGMDSLDFVEILMGVERLYGIYIPDDRADKCETVGDFVTLVNEIRNA